MQSAHPILAPLLELMASALISILIDRLFSTTVAVIALCVCLMGVGYLHRDDIKTVIGRRQPAPQNASPAPLTLEQQFFGGFPDTTRMSLKPGAEFVTFPFKDQSVPVKAQEYFDHLTRAKFVAFFIPSSEHTYDVCAKLADQVKVFLDLLQKVKVTLRDPDQQRPLNGFPFTGKVFLYHEASMTTQERGELIDIYKAKNTEVQFVGSPLR